MVLSCGKGPLLWEVYGVEQQGQQPLCVVHGADGAVAHRGDGRDGDGRRRGRGHRGLGRGLGGVVLVVLVVRGRQLDDLAVAHRHDLSLHAHRWDVVVGLHARVVVVGRRVRHVNGSVVRGLGVHALVGVDVAVGVHAGDAVRAVRQRVVDHLGKVGEVAER